MTLNGKGLAPRFAVLSSKGGEHAAGAASLSECPAASVLSRWPRRRVRTGERPAVFVFTVTTIVKGVQRGKGEQRWEEAGIGELVGVVISSLPMAAACAFSSLPMAAACAFSSLPMASSSPRRAAKASQSAAEIIIKKEQDKGNRHKEIKRILTHNQTLLLRIKIK